MCTNREEQNGLRDEPENSLTIGGSYGTFTKVGRRRVRDEHGAEPGLFLQTLLFGCSSRRDGPGRKCLRARPRRGARLPDRGAPLRDYDGRNGATYRTLQRKDERGGDSIYGTQERKRLRDFYKEG